MPLRIELGAKFSLGQIIGSPKTFSLIHLAGIVGESLVKARHDSYKINVSAASDLAKQSLDLGISKFVFVSSGHVYGSHLKPIREDDVTNPISDYAKQKLEAEESIKSIFSAEPNRLVIARVFSVLDVGMPDASLGGLARKIQLSGVKTTLSTADDVRDFLDRKSIASALETLASSRTASQTYNISSGKGLAVGAALRMFLESQGGNSNLVVDEPGTSPMPKVVGDNSRFTAEFPKAKLIWKWLKEK